MKAYTDDIQFLANPIWLFRRSWQADSKFHIEIQGTQFSQNNHEKEDYIWRPHYFQFQNLLINYSNQGVHTDISLYIQINGI